MGFDVNIFERVKRLMIDRILGSLSEICSGSLERFSVCQFPFVWFRDSFIAEKQIFDIIGESVYRDTTIGFLNVFFVYRCV